MAVRCADHCLLRGDPRVCTPTGLAPLAGAYIDAPQRFLPVLGAAFRWLTPWERMVYLREEPAPRVAAPAGVTVRRPTGSCWRSNRTSPGSPSPGAVPGSSRAAVSCGARLAVGAPAAEGRPRTAA
ncbi:hypothetical protein [Streptomyces silvisoli]|uniref:Uncharacterized protein n=1 Tax=Streptomyces silvisoli TaxID=3034235 RepID=A0ABT5ZIM7_9ACTN|nr:hypothetical protein [Streptomyces silvisoli]MDF3289672.1 hypothetical protein [Streptomyces silvisoli]